jgi:hypothetical protein
MSRTRVTQTAERAPERARSGRTRAARAPRGSSPVGGREVPVVHGTRHLPHRNHPIPANGSGTARSTVPVRTGTRRWHPERAQVEATSAIYQRMITAYGEPDGCTGRKLMQGLIALVSRRVPTALREVVALGRGLAPAPPGCSPAWTGPAPAPSGVTAALPRPTAPGPRWSPGVRPRVRSGRTQARCGRAVPATATPRRDPSQVSRVVQTRPTAARASDFYAGACPRSLRRSARRSASRSRRSFTRT